MAGLFDYVQKVLAWLAGAQVKFLALFVLFLVAFTAFSAVGLTKIELESDLDKFNPQDQPIMILDDKIDTQFNQFSSVVILVELDDSIEGENLPRDIRDPRVMEFLVRLQENLQEEPSVQNVQSAGLIFQAFGVPDDLEAVKEVLDIVPDTSRLFDRGYEMTLVLVEADVGGDSEKIQALNDRVDEIVEASSRPGGIKVTTTGDAPLGSSIFQLLIRDSFFTLIFSTIIIFILLVFLEMSVKKGLIILAPLILGLTWTAGTLGWLGIPITIATAGLSAMLLGLGVEYSIFVVSRYNEERAKNKMEFSLKEALSNVGASITASGTTTMVGFFALMFSVFPMLRDMGLSLGMGIGFMLLSTLLAAPVVILIEEKIEKKIKGEKEIRHGEQVRKEGLKKLKIEKVYRAYGRFVGQKPFLVLMIGLAITVLMFAGIQQIKNQDIDFDTVLPEDLEAMVAYTKITNDFGDSSSAMIYVEIDPSFAGSDEPQDIRDPRVLNYVDILAQKARTVEDVVSVDSISVIVKDANDGFIPDTIASEREIFEEGFAQEFVNDDFSATLIKLSATEDAESSRDEITRQINELIEETAQPPGVQVLAAGSLVIDSEMDKLNGPDSQKTAIFSLIGIILVLYVLTWRLRSTFLPLMTVVIGVIWTLGLGGFFGVPFNNITSSVISMTIGIGIDFGLQVMTRYNYELKRFNRRKAMEETLANILSPLLITVLAALIGFRAMSLGELKIMGDLGTMISFGIVGSMIAAVTIVAALIVLFQRDGKENLK